MIASGLAEARLRKTSRWSTPSRAPMQVAHLTLFLAESTLTTSTKKMQQVPLSHTHGVIVDALHDDHVTLAKLQMDAGPQTAVPRSRQTALTKTRYRNPEFSFRLPLFVRHSVRLMLFVPSPTCLFCDCRVCIGLYLNALTDL